jgi:hypothetical protein
MVTRDLPRAEWFRLSGIGVFEVDLGALADVVPADWRVLVVEDDRGAIVGTLALMRHVHVQGLWIAPAHRKRGRVAGYLRTGMDTVAREWGATWLVTGCVTDEVRDLITGPLGGVPLPDHFIFRVSA